MNWLSGRCGNVWGSMALGAVVLGAMATVPATGHAAGRGDSARHETAAVAKPRAVASRIVAVPSPSAAKAAGCNEALDALALCKLAAATGMAKRPGIDGAASDRRAPDAAPARTASKAIVAAPGTIVDAPAAAAAPAVEAPARLLPVFALGLAIAGVLLGWLGFRALPSNARGRVPGRSDAFRVGAPKRSATAAVAKERLLHYRTAPN